MRHHIFKAFDLSLLSRKKAVFRQGPLISFREGATFFLLYCGRVWSDWCRVPSLIKSFLHRLKSPQHCNAVTIKQQNKTQNRLIKMHLINEQKNQNLNKILRWKNENPALGDSKHPYEKVSKTVSYYWVESRNRFRFITVFLKKI